MNEVNTIWAAALSGLFLLNIALFGFLISKVDKLFYKIGKIGDQVIHNTNELEHKADEKWVLETFKQKEE